MHTTRSAKCRSVSRVDNSEPHHCFIPEEVIGFQVLSYSLHPRTMRASWWSPPVKIFVSVSSGTCKMLSNMEKLRAWTIAERSGCPVVHLNSSFQAWWYRLIPGSFHRHHWLRASILCASLLVTAQHSQPYRKMGRMQLFYSFSSVEMEILHFQNRLSRFYIAAQCTSDTIISPVRGLIHLPTWNTLRLKVIWRRTKTNIKNPWS